MIPKPLDQIGKDDIDALVANQVSERRTLEYKRELPGNADKDKKEFLADVSSFANAAGGDLIYGVVEKRDADNKPTGIPERAPGLAGINADKEILRLESMIREGIKPRIASVHLQPLDDFADGPVIIIRIQKSYAAPHMVTFQDHSRFYSRNSAGKYSLDVGEIRSAFALSESLPEKVRRFRDERLARIVADETPVVLFPSPRIVLHLLPISALEPIVQFDLARFEHKRDDLMPLSGGGSSFRYNLDGVVSYSPPFQGAGSHGYVQLFRNGRVESVESYMLSVAMNNLMPDEKLIPHEQLESSLIHNVKGYLSAQHTLGLEPPIVLMLSLMGVKDYYLAFGRFGDTRQPIDRDALLLPDILVEDFATKPDRLLRPVFDAIWQAAGWPKCQNYDATDKWERRSSHVINPTA